tara:strand:+ start:259 stop:558 length:300 start_codon:yes stop_codon:yes gene_type:complete
VKLVYIVCGDLFILNTCLPLENNRILKMVKEIEQNGKKYYQCEECLMYYLGKDIADRCEKFCAENRACNLDLIKYAVELDCKKNVCEMDCEGDGKKECC